jgi:hypothetical protein
MLVALSLSFLVEWHLIAPDAAPLLGRSPLQSIVVATCPVQHVFADRVHRTEPILDSIAEIIHDLFEVWDWASALVLSGVASILEDLFEQSASIVEPLIGALYIAKD